MCRRARGLLKLFFCCCKDENPNVLHTNWDWFRYYIVNMCLASNDDINKSIALHECFHFERQSWQESDNLEVKNVSPYSLSTSYRRGRWFESHLGNTFFSIRWIYIYLTWRANNIPQSQAFDSIYILPVSFPLLVVPHAVITLETNRCYLEALCLYKIHFFWVATALIKKSQSSLWNGEMMQRHHLVTSVTYWYLTLLIPLRGRMVEWSRHNAADTTM